MRQPANSEHLAPPPASVHGGLWPDTQPMGLEPLRSAAEPIPFREALDGLQVRELVSDELFRLFFGSSR
jgi:hypothetical protein